MPKTGIFTSDDSKDLGVAIANVISAIEAPVNRKNDTDTEKTNPVLENKKQKTEDKKTKQIENSEKSKKLSSANYANSVFELASRTKSFSPLGMLLVLQSLLPPEGMLINITDLAKSLNIDRSNVRKMVNMLTELEVICTEQIGHDRFIRLSEMYLTSLSPQKTEQ